MTLTQLDEKGVRRVRTQAGVRKYGQPIGSIIKPRMVNIRIWPNDGEREEIQIVDHRYVMDELLPAFFGEPSDPEHYQQGFEVYNPRLHGGEERKPGGYLEGPPVFAVREPHPDYPDMHGLERYRGKTKPITHVYRGISEEEWLQAQEVGHVLSDMRGTIIEGWEGTNAGTTAATARAYLPRNGRGIILRIAVNDEDEWFTTDADNYLRTRKPIPLDRVTATSPMLNLREGHVTSIEMPNQKSVHMGDLETKTVRKVRTQAGVRRYNQPIGSIIVRDGLPPLDNISVQRGGYPGWDLVTDNNGRSYDVGRDETTGMWVATIHDDWSNIVVDDAKSEEEVYQLLNEAVKGNRRKGQTTLGSRSMYDTENDRQKGRRAQDRLRDEAKKKYGDKRIKEDYDKYIAAFIVNYDKAVKKGDWDEVRDWYEKIVEQIDAHKRQKEVRERAQAASPVPVRSVRKATKKAVKERAKQVAKQHEVSPQVQETLAGLKRAEERRMEVLNNRVEALSKYTDQESPDFDPDIAKNIESFNQRIAELDGVTDYEQRRSVMERAGIPLDAAERRAVARQHMGVRQHTPGQPGVNAERLQPKKGEVGSTVGIGGMKVEITKQAHRDEYGDLQLAFDFEGREYDITVPDLRDDESVKIVARDKATGTEDSIVMPKKAEAGETAQDRNRLANSRMAELVRRLAKKVGKLGPDKDAREKTLQDGSKFLMHKDHKPLSPFDATKFAAYRRQLDLAINTNDDERAQAVLDLMDGLFKEYGNNPRTGVRSSIRQMRDAVKLMEGTPTLDTTQTMTLPNLRRVASWQLTRFINQTEQQMYALGNPTTKKNKAIVKAFQSNIDKARKVLVEREATA